MYQMAVSEGLNRLTEDDICYQLNRIKTMASYSIDDSGGLGILTTLPRDDWAKARKLLLKGTIIIELLAKIGRELFDLSKSFI